MIDLDLPLQLGVAFPGMLAAVAEDRVVRRLHDVLHPLHLRPHFLDGLPGPDQGHGRRHEGAEQALERGDLTQGKAAVHRQAHAQEQDRVIAHRGDKLGDQADAGIQGGEFDLLGVDGGLVAAPLSEKAALRAGGPDGLRQADARHRRRRQLAFVPHLHAGQVDALIGQIPGHEQVERQGGQADQRHQGAVAQHHHQIKDHHHRVHRQRGHGFDQRARDGRVGALALQNVPGHALGEKSHRQPQDLPHVLGVALDGHLPVDLEGVNRPHPFHHDLENRQGRHHDDEGHKPVRRPAGEQLVKEQPGHDGVDDVKQGADHRGQYDEGHGRPCPAQALSGKGDGALPAAGGDEVLPRLKGQAKAGKGGAELLHAHVHHAPGGVVEHGVLPLKAVQHDKMVKVPVDDAGKRSLLPERLHFHLVAVDVQAVMLAGQENVFHVGAVPADPAVQADLLQRNPFAVIGQHHRQTGRAAFQRFHLHDHRHLRHAFSDRLFQFLVFHFKHPKHLFFA